MDCCLVAYRRSACKKTFFVAFSLLFPLLLLLATPVQASPRVEIFITSWCPYCKMLEQALKANGVPFTKYDIEKNETGKRLHEALGGGGVPLTRIDRSTVVRGYNPQAIQEALRRPKASKDEPTI